MLLVLYVSFCCCSDLSIRQLFSFLFLQVSNYLYWWICCVFSTLPIYKIIVAYFVYFLFFFSIRMMMWCYFALYAQPIVTLILLLLIHFDPLFWRLFVCLLFSLRFACFNTINSEVRIKTWLFVLPKSHSLYLYLHWKRRRVLFYIDHRLNATINVVTSNGPYSYIYISRKKSFLSLYAELCLLFIIRNDVKISLTNR